MTRYMISNQILVVLLLCFLAFPASAQENTTSPTSAPSQLQLAQTYVFNLQADSQAIWFLVLPQQIPQQNDLFLTVQSPANQPLQQPYLLFSADTSELQRCDTANNEFVGICRLDAALLKPKLNITIKAKCTDDCQLQVLAALAPRLLMEVGSVLQLKAPDYSAREFQFEMQVPLDLQFTEMALYAQLEDYSIVGGGLQLLANIGDKNREIPTTDKNDQSGQSIFWGGLAIYFSRQDFNQNNNWIKIYLSIAAGTDVKLYTKFLNGNSFTIKLNQAYFEYTTNKEEKFYMMDLKPQHDILTNKTIAIGFIIYAGQPNIQVSFDPDFTNALKGTEGYGTINYLITEQMRKDDPAYKQFIYLKINSTWNADFYFFTALYQSNSIFVQPSNSYYITLPQNQTFNYFFDDTVYYNSSDPEDTTNRTYSVKMHVTSGTGKFGIRRCKAVEQQNDESKCLISTIEQTTTEQFKKDMSQIATTNKVTDNFIIFVFEYDLSTCMLVGANEEMRTYYCDFQGVVANSGATALTYTISFNRNSYSSRLKEGLLRRDMVFEDQMLYYQFGLSSLDDVEEVAFFVTVIEGDVELLGSTSEPYPNFDSDPSKTIASATSRLVFKKPQLKSPMFLSIYGLSYAQYTLGVVVKRSKSISNATVHNSSKISLQPNLNQDYSLSSQQTQAVFLISALQDETITIQVVQLVDTVTMQVRKPGTSQEVECGEKEVTSTMLGCDLQMSAGEKVQVVITGQRGTVQHLVIVYHKADSCIPYSLNMPLYQQLATTTICVAFTVTTLTDLQLSTSVPISHLIQNNVRLTLCINGNCLRQPDFHHYTISKDILQIFCEWNPNQRVACPVRVNISNQDLNVLHFYMILEEKGLDVALFDGIVERVTTEDLSKKKSKQFYFEVASDNTLRIYFTSFTDDFYCVLAHFVSEKDFSANSSTVYLDYIQRQAGQDNKTNFYRFYKAGQGSDLFAITAEDVKKNCKSNEQCFLTLAVYSLQQRVRSKFSAFEVEISQQQTLIQLGQAKHGYLQKDDIYLYQLQQPTTGDAIVSVRDLSTQSFTQNNCFRLSRENVGFFGDDDTIVIRNMSTELKLFVEGTKDLCEFQVSYTSLEQPLSSAVPDRSYSFKAKPGAKVFYTYTHNEDQSFRVVKILSSGSATISITPINKDHSLKQSLKADPSSYPVVGAESDSIVTISNKPSYFCYECTYLIAVSTVKGAEGQLIITGTSDALPISVKGILNDKIVAKENKHNHYTFSSIVDFNVTVNVIYGQIKVTVIDPDDKVIINDSIVGKSVVLQIEPTSDTQKYTYEYESIFTTFKINIQADVDASYTLKASKLNITKRLFEGVSTYLSLHANEPAILQFNNLWQVVLSTHPSLNILIEIADNQVNLTNLPQISLSAVSAIDTHTPTSSLQIISKQTSQASINYELPLRKGNYYINITSQRDTFISILLVKQTIIHLKADSNLLMTKPGIFELYSPQKSVMLEIFACQGDIFIQATDTFKDFDADEKSSKQIALQQTNYGGHFIVSSEYVFGQYFVQVGNKDPHNSKISYLINYYYYSIQQALPYRLIELDSPQISYALGPSSITFTLQPIIVKNLQKSPINSYIVNYFFYFSNRKEAVMKYANCRLDQVQNRAPTTVTSNTVQFVLQTNELNSLDSIYFVGAEAVVDLEVIGAKTLHYPRQLSLTYDIIQLSDHRAPPAELTDTSYSPQTIFFWILFPFALAGLALYLAIRFFIKKYRGMVPDDLVEEEAAESDEIVNHEGRPKNSNASGTFKYYD